MADKTNIGWTERTWNPWYGCHKVSPGCKNCYMFRELLAYGGEPNMVKQSKTKFNDPLRWQRRLDGTGKAQMVFTCSWSDWFIEEADPWRGEAWAIIRRCPNLTFQVLTKRPERILAHLPADWGGSYPNVWLGVSIENNDHAWRADYLRQAPAVVRFVSYEPALGPLGALALDGLHWVIYGGESGPGFRPENKQWARDMRDRCRAAGVTFFHKQSAGPFPERGFELDGEVLKAFPATRRVPLTLFG
jgi:protein gp37